MDRQPFRIRAARGTQDQRFACFSVGRRFAQGSRGPPRGAYGDFGIAQVAAFHEGSCARVGAFTTR
jgi:hypothetical protein